VWRHPHQRGQLALGEAPQLGQLRQQRQGQRRPDARHTAQQVLLLTPERAGLHALLQIVVECLEVSG
jgi:hypothetical protein